MAITNHERIGKCLEQLTWRPANAEESFEIVLRRLFQPITDPALFTARDNVAKAFCDLYRRQHQEFPPECREGDYERKLKAAYPIHPEIFDRLYQDWSGLVKFQRTRGDSFARLRGSPYRFTWIARTGWRKAPDEGGQLSHQDGEISALKQTESTRKITTSLFQ